MNTVTQNLLVAVLAVNAIFWGLMPHKVHCEAASMLRFPCISHKVHLSTGIIAFILAVIVAQWDYIKKLM